MHSIEDVRRATLEYFDGDALAADVWVNKYALRDEHERFLELTPADMHRRLAREFARVEARYPNPMSEDEVFALLDRFRYVVPQGSPMSAVGNPYQVQSLSNCFVVPSPADSYGSILRTDQQQAQVMKRRGGVGFDISNIRPRGMPTSNAARTSDGIGVFMERFSNTCREVAQGGRRGALMLTCDVAHPDVETFVDIKRDLRKVTGANISLRVSDEFMRAVEAGSKFMLRWPLCGDPSVAREVDARVLWDKLVDAAWTSAEPGVLFWDAVKRATPTECYADVGYGSVSTNPCSEIQLSPYDSCRLMVVNLTSFVRDPWTAAASFDFDAFGDVVERAQRLMDDLVDLELEAVERIIAKVEADPEDVEDKRCELDMWREVYAAASAGRRTGLGVTAVGDCIAALGVVYGSAESVEVVGHIYRRLALSAYRSSVTMAEERGTFPCFSLEKERGFEFIERIMSLDDDLRARWERFGRRNIALTTTAPVGSVSTLTQTTSGIEPAYMLRYRRRRKVPSDSADVGFVDDVGDSWQEYDVYHHGLKAWMDATGSTWDDVASSPYAGATSMDIDWRASVDLQAAAQRWVCHGISKTCNVPSDATRELVSDVYMRAWRSGCKGFTVYRDGSRTGVLVAADEPQPTTSPMFGDRHAPKRPEVLECEVHRSRVEGSEWTIFVGMLDGRPYEVFGGMSSFVEIPRKHTRGTLTKRSYKVGGKYDLACGEGDDAFRIRDIVKAFDDPDHAAFTRMISLSLRHGAPVQYVVEQLQRDPKADLHTFAKVMARVLKRFIPDGTTPCADKVCGTCGAEGSLAYIEGCVTCSACGMSRCG